MLLASLAAISEAGEIHRCLAHVIRVLLMRLVHLWVWARWLSATVSWVHSCVYSGRPLVIQSVLFPPCLNKVYPHQVSDTSIWWLVVHACTGRMLGASGAGGNINECDQCCQVVEGDQREMVAPQWDVWVVCNSPQLLKGNCVKSDMLQPADANTDSQLW